MTSPVWLAEAERAVLARLFVPKRRGDWLLGRWAAKRALVAVGEAEREADVSVLAGPSGAPEAFVLGRPSALALSLTHSHGVAVAALAPAGVSLGVDLERIEERSDSFLADWFTERERAFVAASTEPDRALAAAVVWTAKEAVMKALREGLRIPAKAVQADPVPGAADGAWRPFEARGPAESGWRGWWRAEDGFALAVAAGPPLGVPDRIG